ncbi:MAG: hypothetical protein ACYCXW_05525 [Solirubrobacteraceae bacterium]
MPRTHKLTALASTLALTIGGASVALAATGAGPQKKPAAPTATAVARADAARHLTRFRGTIVSRDRSHGWFQMRTTTNQRVRIYTNRGSHWHGCDWGSMGYGHHVDIHAYRSHGRWYASSIGNWNRWGNDGWGNGHWGPGGWMWDHGGHSHGGWDDGGMMS